MKIHMLLVLAFVLTACAGRTEGRRGVIDYSDPVRPQMNFDAYEDEDPLAGYTEEEIDSMRYDEPADEYDPDDGARLSIEDGCPHGCRYPVANCLIKGNISITTGEKIYHVPGQKWYNETRISPEYGEAWFCTEAEAKANGFRRSYE